MSAKLNLKEIQITTSPTLIKLLGEKLYQNATSVILARELLQNSRDACLKTGGKIKITFDTQGIICEDTGCGMDEDTLLNTFLCIGKSGKKADGEAVGGFGIAKVSLFAQDFWSVETNGLRIESNKAGEIVETDNAATKNGTTVTAGFVPPEDYLKRSRFNRTTFMLVANSLSNLWVNGKKVRPLVGKRFLGAGTYGNSNTFEVWAAPKIKITDVDGDPAEVKNVILYRIRGLTQYFETAGYGEEYGCNFIVEFNDISYRPTDEHYPFSLSREKADAGVVATVNQILKPMLKNNLTTQVKSASLGKKERTKINPHTGWLYVNKPSHTNPVDRKMAVLWERIVTDMAPVLTDSKIRIGLTYEDGTAAECRTHLGNTYILLNPVMLASEKHSSDNSLGLVMRLWHLACHEMTHLSKHDHDEEFTSAQDYTASLTADIVSADSDKLRYMARKILHDRVFAE